MRLPSPILTPPMIFAPAPTTTLFPSVGWRFSRLRLVPARLALVDRDVLPHLRGLADHDTHAVVDEEARTELRGRVDLDAGHEPREVRDEARHCEPPVMPERMRQPMEHERVHARVAQEDLERRPGRRVTLEHRPDVAPERVKHRVAPGPGGRGPRPGAA